jgi:cytoskeletal protein CcmA (bactofilin family)
MAIFGNNKQEETMTKQTHGAAPQQVTMIGEGTVFEGSLRVESDIRIGGQIIGTLQVGGRVIVAPEGSVEGEMQATEADISGRVEGDLDVEGRLILRGTGRVEGNVRTARLIVEEGAVFNGECLMGARRQAAAPAGEVLEKEGQNGQQTHAAERAGSVARADVR